MNYRFLGRSGVRVSEVSLGGWLTHGRTLDAGKTSEIVHRAFDLGINFLDTADVYHNGEAEKALAVATEGMRRQDLFIATKCFFPFTQAPNDRGNNRKHVFESVHASLERLKTNYVDLFQFHRYDADTPLEETVRAIDDLIRQGKVLYWGVSEWKAHQIAEVWHIAKALNAHPPISNQPSYSMLARGIEDAVIPISEKVGVGQVVFSPLAQGVLTGKYLPGQAAPEGTRGADASSNMFMGNVMTDEVLTRVQTLKAFAAELGLELAEFALAWILRQKNVSSVIVGASRIEQIEQNARASGVTFGADVWERAEAILEGRDG